MSMFFKSILEGFKLLFYHWEIWISILFYITVPQLLIKHYTYKNIRQLMYILPDVLLFFQQAILFAIILSFSYSFRSDISYSDFLFDYFIFAILALLIAKVIVFIFKFLPIISNFISEDPSTYLFIQGVVLYRFLGKFSNEFVSLNSPLNFWYILSFFLLSSILVFIAIFVLFMISTGLRLKPNSFINRMIADFRSVLPAVLSLCIYSSYLQLIAFKSI